MVTKAEDERVGQLDDRAATNRHQDEKPERRTAGGSRRWTGARQPGRRTPVGLRRHQEEQFKEQHNFKT